MPIQKPMLASPLAAVEDLSFPVLASAKVDGIRSMIVNGKLVSRTLKPIPNRAVCKALEAILPEGADGELVYGDTFQSATSAVMTQTFVPENGERFTFYWFDYVKDAPEKQYSERMNDLIEFCSEAKMDSDVVEVVPLYPQPIDTVDALDAYEAEVLEDGFEGVMLRKPDGKYKFGRSTAKEGLLLKLKRFEDDEAVVIGVEELRRTDAEDNKVPGGVLGALVCETRDKVRFKIGTGFSAELRKELWKQRKELVGKWAKFKYLNQGVKIAPRHPVFLGFRDPIDV
jgi:DNA ligase 1